MTADNGTAAPSEPTPVQKARADLVATLSEIEDRLNIPKRALRKARELRRDRPLLFAGLAGAAAAATGLLGWLVIAVRRR